MLQIFCKSDVRVYKVFEFKFYNILTKPRAQLYISIFIKIHLHTSTIGNVTNNKLFNFIGHSLEQVRKRALQNLLSKLEFGIVHFEDILNHRELYSSLLEFLNRHEDEKSVLHLLAQLSKVCEYTYLHTYKMQRTV